MNELRQKIEEKNNLPLPIKEEKNEFENIKVEHTDDNLEEFVTLKMKHKKLQIIQADEAKKEEILMLRKTLKKIGKKRRRVAENKLELLEPSLKVRRSYSLPCSDDESLKAYIALLIKE